MANDAIYSNYHIEHLTMKIQTIREERGIRQRDLAKKLKMSQSYLSNLEAGKVNVSLYTFYIRCAVLQRL
jgi:transcriptional regulator with XRE-family HTH domain